MNCLAVEETKGARFKLDSILVELNDYVSACYKFLDIIAVQIPLPDELFINAWQHYLDEAENDSLFFTLQRYLVQLQFPIQAGISKTAPYLETTRRGKEKSSAFNLGLQMPENLNCTLQKSCAGTIPVLSTSNRCDFIYLVQALIHKNEPVPIPDSMGACMIAGYNNWGRIRAYRAQWEAENPNNCSETAWQAEFKRLIPQKHLYQDRFLILSDGPYSGVSAEAMGLNEDEWRDLSLKIRLEHECAHYFTKRIFGMMRRHLFDELLADYAGITAVSPHFRADWFLRFMGLENFPHYRAGGRLQNYIDVPPGGEAFTAVQSMLKAAAENLEAFDLQAGPTRRNLKGKAALLLAITYLNLPQLALPEAPELLHEALNEVEQKQGEKPDGCK